MKIEGHGQAKILSSEEINRLFTDGLMTNRDRALFGICLYTGCRISEACSLSVSDVFDSEGRVLKRVTIRKGNTKGKQETRQIPTNPKLKAYLEAYGVPKGKTVLFPGRHGRGQLNPRSADEILREAYERVSIPGASTHSFRRTALTQMSTFGVPLRVIQEISGHRSLQALQRYLEVTEGQVEGAISTLNF